MKKWLSLEGRAFDLSALNPDEKGCLSELLLAYEQMVPYEQFMNLMYLPGSPVLQGGSTVTRQVSDSALYHVAEDLRFRLGIRQGVIAPDPGDLVEGEPLSDAEWLPVAEAAKQKNVSVMGIHKAIQRAQLLSRTYPGQQGMWISRASLETYRPSAADRRARRTARELRFPRQED